MIQLIIESGDEVTIHIDGGDSFRIITGENFVQIIREPRWLEGHLASGVPTPADIAEIIYEFPQQ